MAIQLFRCPYCDKDNEIDENTCLLYAGMTLQCAHCKTELEMFLIYQEQKSIDKLTIMELCPRCSSPIKIWKSENGNFRLYCKGRDCKMTAWYPTEREAREAWIEKSVEILGIVEEE